MLLRPEHGDKWGQTPVNGRAAASTFSASGAMNEVYNTPMLAIYLRQSDGSWSAHTGRARPSIYGRDIDSHWDRSGRHAGALRAWWSWARVVAIFFEIIPVAGDRRDGTH
jgi:hypothetical protein